MLDTKAVWNKFKAYPWWLRVLVFLPMVLLVVLVGALMIFMQSKDVDSSPAELFQEKKELDKKIKDFEETHEIIEKERKEIAKQRKEIKKELENEKTDYSDRIDRINNATDDELSGIAAEIRARSSKDLN